MNAANELLTFIENSPSMFHSIETIKGMLDASRCAISSACSFGTWRQSEAVSMADLDFQMS